MTHTYGSGGSRGATQWDARYADTDLVWGAGPNQFVVEHIAGLPPGRAVDLACGEGRNAVYLAHRGWQVTGVDFSEVAIDKARRLEQSVRGSAAPEDSAAAEGPATTEETALPVTWICADVTTFEPDPVDLALVVYAHLPVMERRAVLAHAASALARGGHLLVIGHNTRNIAEGTGGPQDPNILYTATDLIDDLGEVAPDLLVEVTSEPLRDVSGVARAAIDTVVLARLP